MLPKVIAVTNPVEDIVAIEVLEDVHGVVAFAVTDPVNCEVPPTQEDKIPAIVGIGFTVKVAVIIHPNEFV